MKFTSIEKPISKLVLDEILHFFETGEKSEISTPRFLCEGFCLYSAMIALNIQEEDFDFYNDESRDADIKEHLLLMNKHKNKTDDELNSFIKENNKKDLRNAFSHGNFEVIREKGYNWLVLNPTRPHNPSSYQILIAYGEIYKMLAEKFNSTRAKYLSMKNHSQEERNDYFIKLFSLPFIEMAHYFSNHKYPKYQTQEFIQNGEGLLAQFLLGVETSYEQNNLVPFLKSSPENAKKLCVFRNSLIHSLTKIDKNKMQFVDIDPKTNEQTEVSLSPNEFRHEILKIQSLAILELIEEFDKELDDFIQIENPELKENMKKKFQKLYKEVGSQAKRILAKQNNSTEDEEKEDN